MHLKYTKLILKEGITWDEAFINIEESMREYFDEYECDWKSDKHKESKRGGKK